MSNVLAAFETLPLMTLDYLCSEDDNSKTRGAIGIFYADLILHERKILVLKEWNNRTIVTEVFLELPESYVFCIVCDKCVLVAFNHELLLQALSAEQKMEQLLTCRLEMLPGTEGSAVLSCHFEQPECWEQTCL